MYFVESGFMYGMDRRKLRLMPHDAVWATDFAEEKRRIVAATTGAFLSIEHIGSTSIPAIHAKPILDIAILCNGKTLESLASALVKLGYEYRGQYEEKSNHYYAVLDDGDVRFCQAHIYTEADADWHSKIKFRDVLRRDARLASEYDEYKLKLAQTASDKSEYAAIKSKWVDAFVSKVDASDFTQ